MKRFICILLICALIPGLLAGCDRQNVTQTPAEEEQVVNFAPETTAVASQQQAQAVQNEVEAQQDAVIDQPVAADVPVDEPVAQDATVEPAAEATAEPVSSAATISPYLATPQPNAKVTSYSEVSNTGLGFKFSHPSDWVNIPGRHTVCYVQPLEDGTVYPARVAISMKTVAHAVGDKSIKAELAEYVKLLMSQYDEKTFEVDENLNTDTKFMGNSAMSTTYLAYDGKQEIKGYVIMTHFEKYIFCFHFLCAYEDYAALESAMVRMRDSVQPEEFGSASEN